MEHGSAARVEQLVGEQRSIDLMYATLDAEKRRIAAGRAATLALPVHGPEARQARDAELSRSGAALTRLQHAEDGLCFGRIDRAGGESLHVGRIGLRSESGEVLLVDWRAEAARPFYTATMVSSSGVRRRRHLRVRDRQVVDISDEILDGTPSTTADVVGDGPLVAALTGARTGRMREAAATLQREQDEIVRSAHRGITVVDGGPGTGKTIVALHRAAYVLYAFPAIAERGVLVFGPNRSFLTYIADVLPSLGENEVELATAPDLAGIEPTRPEPDAITRAKGRAAVAEELARRVQERQPQGVSLEISTAYGIIVLDAARVDAARRSALQGGTGHNRARAVFLELVVEDVVDELERQTAREMFEFEDELREAGIDLDRMFSRHADDDGIDAGIDALDIDWDGVRDALRDDIGIDRIVGEVWPRLHPEEILRELMADTAALNRVMIDLSSEQIAQLVSGETGWGRADVALLDEARALVEGLPETTYGHIVVDEAQQLTEMEWRMLMRRCPGRSMTIVGDLAQAGPETTIGTWEDALSPFAADRFVHHTLTVNYRTTAEILEQTETILGRIAPAQRLSRSIRRGERPTDALIADADVGGAVDDLVARLRSEHPEEMIAVIASARRARTIRRRPSADGVTVVAAPDARGLEFDTVIIVDPDEIEAASTAGLRDLYVAKTRATKRLFTFSIASSGTTPSDAFTRHDRPILTPSPRSR